MVAVHLPFMINSDENAGHLSVIWKMPHKDAEPATDLLPFQWTAVKVFSFGELLLVFRSLYFTLYGELALGLELWQMSRQAKCAVSHPTNCVA